jgi:hypothetical protein
MRSAGAKGNPWDRSIKGEKNPLEASISEPQCVVKTVKATTSFDCISFATHFSGNVGATLSNRPSNFLGQVEISTDAFTVGTLETKHGLNVAEVDHILELILVF